MLQITSLYAREALALGVIHAGAVPRHENGGRSLLGVQLRWLLGARPGISSDTAS